MGEFASKLLDRIKLPFVVIILAIDLACAGIIFLPEKLREMLYLESFRRNFIQWIGPSFFILTLLLIMYVLLSVFKFVGNSLQPFIRKRIDEEIEKEENWKADIRRKLSNPNLKECKRKELQKELEKHEETMQIVSNYKKHYR